MGIVLTLITKLTQSNTKFQNMKSHNYHVFFEALLPIAFSALPVDVLEPLSAISEYFKTLCADVLHKDHLTEMHHNIPIILCKLKKIFPPRFWNVMEHLLVHFRSRLQANRSYFECLMISPILYHYQSLHLALLNKSNQFSLALQERGEVKDSKFHA